MRLKIGFKKRALISLHREGSIAAGAYTHRWTMRINDTDEWHRRFGWLCVESGDLAWISKSSKVSGQKRFLDFRWVWMRILMRASWHSLKRRRSCSILIEFGSWSSGLTWASDDFFRIQWIQFTRLHFHPFLILSPQKDSFAGSLRGQGLGDPSSCREHLWIDFNQFPKNLALWKRKKSNKTALFETVAHIFFVLMCFKSPSAIPIYANILCVLQRPHMRIRRFWCFKFSKFELFFELFSNCFELPSGRALSLTLSLSLPIEL